MEKKLSIVFVAGLSISVAMFAAEPMSTAEIIVDCTTEIGAIKPMNAVNNGPVESHMSGGQKRSRTRSFRRTPAGGS